MSTNQLLYGDNLDILRRYVAEESVDLVYLDPPFKSNPFRMCVGQNDMLAYLSMMAPRLAEARHEVHREPLSALRSDVEPLPEAAVGRRLRTTGEVPG